MKKSAPRPLKLRRVGRLDLHDDVTGKRGVELLVGVLRGVQEDRIYGTSGLLYAVEIEVPRRRASGTAKP